MFSCQQYFSFIIYSDTVYYCGIQLIRPPSCWNWSNSEQVSLMTPINIEKCILVQKQVVLIAKVVLISSVHYSVPLQIERSVVRIYTGLTRISQGTRKESPRLHSTEMWIGTLRGLCLFKLDIPGTICWLHTKPRVK